jgi:hypothetical protein
MVGDRYNNVHPDVRGINMKYCRIIWVLMMVIVVVGLSLFVKVLLAHCDTMSGPIIPEAKASLEKGDITPILKWIKPENEREVRQAFLQAVKVRAQSPEAKELADRYFLETLIRLHRAGEGAPYAGLKDTPPEKIVLLADEALVNGSVDPLIKMLQDHLATSIREKFDPALKASKNKDKSIESGREYVESYVLYMHYIEGIHAAIQSKGSHDSIGAESNTNHSEPSEHTH